MRENQVYPLVGDDPVSGRRRLYYWPEAFEPYGDVLVDSLLDVGEARIKEMDRSGIDVAVLSLASPGIDHFYPVIGNDLAERCNNVLAEAIAKYPTRFMGWAALATKDIPNAVAELERCVKELGFKGWKTHSNYRNIYLDDERFWPILAKAEELDVPVFLSPSGPLNAELRAYGLALAGAGFGFAIEAATIMMRLVLGGVFDAFPKLRIILGNYGEGLPFALQRVDYPYVRPHAKPTDPDAAPDLKHLPSHYLRENMGVTTSGNYSAEVLACAKAGLGIDKIMLGTGYPYHDIDECLSFLEGAGLADDEKAQVYNANATEWGFA